MKLDVREEAATVQVRRKDAQVSNYMGLSDVQYLLRQSNVQYRPKCAICKRGNHIPVTSPNRMHTQSDSGMEIFAYFSSSNTRNLSPPNTYRQRALGNNSIDPIALAEQPSGAKHFVNAYRSSGRLVVNLDGWATSYIPVVTRFRPNFVYYDAIGRDEHIEGRGLQKRGDWKLGVSRTLRGRLDCPVIRISILPSIR